MVQYVVAIRIQTERNLMFSVGAHVLARGARFHKVRAGRFAEFGHQSGALVFVTGALVASWRHGRPELVVARGVLPKLCNLTEWMDCVVSKGSGRWTS